jgi:hypothetical protein
MKKNLAFPLLVGVMALSASHWAFASHVNVGIRIGGAPVYAPAPVYVVPPPVYYAPAPVYYAPAPVYVAPAPVYIAPAPVGRISVSIGWHGDNYWDGHRYWSRHDWQNHHPDPWRR